MAKHYANQFGFDLRVPVKLRVKPVAKRAKPVRVVTAQPMTEEQLQWAMGHNLTWLLSLLEE